MSEKLRILVVDDDRRMAKTLVDIFRVKGHEADAAYSGSDALDRMERGEFDCILSDIRMPDINGVELYRAIKEIRPEVPVVLMTAYSEDGLVAEGLAEGVIGIMTKPLDINGLLSLFSTLRKERTVVIVDDDPQFCEMLGELLRVRGFGVTWVVDPTGLEGVLQPDGQVVLLDMKLGEASGLEVLEEIREEHPDLPVVLVTGYREEMQQSIEAALCVGAYTCLYKPFRSGELFQVLQEIRHQELRGILEEDS